ncbi:MAG: MFS transporter [Lachnospiraceae bacterium]|nr:MFS transporter [Lachnospiraceae bacterium]
MNQNFKRYMIFWLSQSVSQLGSAMTGFALILWAYEESSSAMAVSAMAFCNYVPYIIISLFAGGYVDRHRKKRIMLLSDTIAAICSVTVLILNVSGKLAIRYIYLVNVILGSMNAIQSPAVSVATGKMVPKERLAQVSGMNSFSGNLIAVITPVLAAAIYGFGGMSLILAIDLGSFWTAFLVLLLLISVPEEKKEKKRRESAFAGCKLGFQFLHKNKGIWMIVLTMSVLNFFSRLTYENILPPMILARSGHNSIVLGIVNAMIGIGGIAGGVIVSVRNEYKDRIKMIYIPAMISFLFGDLLMGLGQNVIAWSVAGIAASFPIPFIMAAQNVILYEKIPQQVQGRVFAVRNAIQFSTIPAGILLGGFLADYVFEPFMQSQNAAAIFLHHLVGDGEGSGMAVMFLCTGICGSVFSLMFSHRKEMDELR